MEDGTDNNSRDEIYSRAVRAGKRTYFFDVKTTRGNDLYLTITESKKRFHPDGKHYYEKHKLFLYKEDFDKFALGLNEAVEKIQELRDSGNFQLVETTSESTPTEETTTSITETEEPVEEKVSTDFTNVSFEDLGSTE